MAKKELTRDQVREAMTGEDIEWFLRETFSAEFADCVLSLLNYEHTRTVEVDAPDNEVVDPETGEITTVAETDEVEDATLIEGEGEAADDTAVEEEGEEEPEGEEGDGEGEGEEEPEAEGEVEAESEEEEIGEPEAEGEPEPEAEAEEVVAEPKKAGKKPKAVEETAAKPGKAGKGKKAVEVEVVETTALRFEDLLGDKAKALVAGAAKELADVKPAKLKALVVDLGVEWPKALSGKKASDVQRKDFTASVVAAFNHLSGLKLTALEKLAAANGVEISYGRTKKEDARKGMAVAALIGAVEV